MSMMFGFSVVMKLRALPMAVDGVKNIRDYLDKEVIALLRDETKLLELMLPHIEELTFRIRELTIIPYSKTLVELNASQCQRLSKAFQEHSTRGIAEWSQTQPEFKDPINKKKLASVYHRAPHGAEMRKDAELFLQQENMQALFQEPHHRQLFSKMAEAAHAMHDVIQHLGPLKNEIKSFLIFAAHCKEICSDAHKEHLITEKQGNQLYTAAKIFGWETIVAGTIFDFTEKMPFIDILNRKSAEEQKQPSKTTKLLYPAQRDPAIACATFAAGKNDTRRMEVVLDGYLTDPDLKQLIDEQFDATGGFNNIFMRFLKENHTYSERELIAFRHMFGQNCRMICEIKTHFAKDESDLEFAEFFAQLILKASEQFDTVQWESLKSFFADLDDATLQNYFQKILSSFEGNFGEIAFAKGLNSKIFDEAMENFNQLYPQYAFTKSNCGALWTAYANALEGFIPYLKTQIAATSDPKADNKLNRKLMVHAIIDFALYGGHQIGHALLRQDNDLATEYEIVIERIRQMAQAMFHRPLPSSKTQLNLLVKYQEAATGTDVVANLTKKLGKFSLDPEHTSLGRPEYTPKEKQEALHMLYTAKLEQHLLEVQRENAQQATQRKRKKSASFPTTAH